MVGGGKTPAGEAGPASSRCRAVPGLGDDLADCAGVSVLEGRREGLVGGHGRLCSQRGHQGELRPLWVSLGTCARQARAGVGTP